MAPIEPTSLNSRRRRLDLVPLMFATERPAVPSPDKARKRRRSNSLPAFVRHCDNVVMSPLGNEEGKEEQEEADSQLEVNVGAGELAAGTMEAVLRSESTEQVEVPLKFRMTSVCGWRRDMEYFVLIHPLLSNNQSVGSSGFHFFSFFDGHGCSHEHRKFQGQLIEEQDAFYGAKPSL